MFVFCSNPKVALNSLNNVSKSSNNGEWVPTIVQTLSKVHANESNLGHLDNDKNKLIDYTHLVNKTLNMCQQTCQASWFVIFLLGVDILLIIILKWEVDVENKHAMVHALCCRLL